jgi:3-oxoacyl-[acyl-carrier-protein] synthase II
VRRGVVITGIGLITPLGEEVRGVLRRVQAGESAAAPPTGFDATPFACRVCAEVRDFDAHRQVPGAKLVRLMNRDAQLAVAAARLAVLDARLRVGTDYPPEEIGLYGATGLAGVPWGEVAPLVRASTGADGQLDLERFGRVGLKAVSPLLSFKVLGNMPVCFVSIAENLQGPNAVYTPWEGHGAQAIEAGAWAIRSGELPCALVGGCDVKTHELAFLSLEQHGVFDSWKTEGAGAVPGEGAVWLVLEDEDRAAARGARVCARLAGASLCSGSGEVSRREWLRDVLRGLGPGEPAAVVAAAEDASMRRDEAAALELLAPRGALRVHPKPLAGNLFAGAAALQVALAAAWAQALGQTVLADCFGQGREQGAFRLDPP